MIDCCRSGGEKLEAWGGRQGQHNHHSHEGADEGAGEGSSWALWAHKVSSERPEKGWWPLLTVQSEANGDSWSTNEKGPSLVGSLGLLCRYKKFMSCLGYSGQFSSTWAGRGQTGSLWVRWSNFFGIRHCFYVGSNNMFLLLKLNCFTALL